MSRRLLRITITDPAAEHPDAIYTVCTLDLSDIDTLDLELLPVVDDDGESTVLGQLLCDASGWLLRKT